MPVIVAATQIKPPDGEFCWAFHLANDSAEPIAEVIVETVSCQWGDSASSRAIGQVLGPVASGGCIELLREAATEVRMSLTLRVRGPFGERVIEADVERLDRGSDPLLLIPILGLYGRLARISTADVHSKSRKELRPKWHRVRSLKVPQASRAGSAIDAGSGIVVYEGRSGGLCAVDVQSGRSIWRSQSLCHLVDSVWLDGDSRLCCIDPRTAEPRQYLGQQSWRWLRGGGRAFLLGTHTLGKVSCRRRSIDWGNEEPSDFWISLYDIASGKETGSIRHEGDHALPFPLGDDFIVSFDDRVACFDRVGQQKWSFQERSMITAIAEGRIFLNSGAIHDVHTGQLLAKLDGHYGHIYTTTDALVWNELQHIAVYDRTTLLPRWRRERSGGTTRGVTSDAVLLLDATDHDSRHCLVRSVTALDLATGKEVASIDVESARCTLDSTLVVSDTLVLFCMLGGPPVVIVD